MKKNNFHQKLVIYLLLIFIVNKSYGQQVTYSTSGQPTTYSFQIDSLTTSSSSAFYSHFWWFGDNGFSFLETPNYVYQDWSSNGSVTRHLFTAPTENYGTGGPPPLADTITPTSGTYPIHNVLQPGEHIQIQRYRNAVIDDTLYLIITYSAPAKINTPASGRLSLTIDQTTQLLSSYTTAHPEFLPNGEVYGPSIIINFSGLKKNEERSVLIPIKVNSQAEEIVEFRVDLNFKGKESPPKQGVTYDIIEVIVADSHDPNKMVEHSNASNLCDFGGETIKYIVEFQNDGDTTTKFVSVTTFLDSKLNIKSINSIIAPKEYGGMPVEPGNLHGQYQANAGAIYHIDMKKRTITFEFHDLVLRSTQDPSCKNLDLTRSMIKFSIKVKDNYIFGDAVSSYSSILFDENDPIVTNSVHTICRDPYKMGNGGGFYEQTVTPSKIESIKKNEIIKEF